MAPSTVATDMPTEEKERIEGLCAWRAILMLGGLLLHATIGQEDYLPFMAINILSGSFRMGTFFMIAGLLSGFALMRRSSPHTWIRERLFRLGVPTTFALLVICPAIGAITSIRTTAPMPSFSMYHLWFMVTLIAYSSLAYIIHRVDRRWPVFHYVERRSSVGPVRQLVVLMGTGTVSFVLIIMTSRMLASLAEPLSSLTRQVPLMIGYAPMFLLGLAIARTPTLGRSLITGARIPTLILITVVAAHSVWWLSLRPAIDVTLAGSINHLLIFASAAWCPPATAVLILRSASSIRYVPLLLRRLSDASLTMYILHYPIIVILKIVITPMHWHPWLEWIVAVIVAGTISYFAHAFVVERSQLAGLLLNGRRPTRPYIHVNVPQTAQG